MTPAASVILWTGNGLLLATLLGLWLRGGYRSCYSFTAYMAAVLGPQILFTLWPERFLTYPVWILKETLHAVLKLAVVFEVSYRTLRGFPGALATGRRLGLAVTGVVFALVVSFPGGGPAEFAVQLLPRILNGTIWLFVALSALVLWYRLPLDPLHKAILVGFVPYLLVFSVAQTLLHSFGWGLLPYVGRAHTTAYLVLTGYWACAAWRRERPRVLLSPR